MDTIPCNSRCTAGMTTNCCSPCLRPKQSSCRSPFKVCVSPPLEKLPESESCWCWKRTAARGNSYPAVGIPSAKSRGPQGKKRGAPTPLVIVCVVRKRDRSEVESGAKLHLPHVGRGGRIRIEVPRGELVDVSGEIRVVQGVEHLPAKLERLVLRNLEPLAEGQIQIRQSRQSQVVAPARPVLSKQRLADGQRSRLNGALRDRMQLASIAIEGSGHHAVGRIRRAIQQSVRNPHNVSLGAARHRVRRYGADVDRCGVDGGRKARLDGENPALAPAIQHVLLPAVEAVRAGWLEPERDF